MKTTLTSRETLSIMVDVISYLNTHFILIFFNPMMSFIFRELKFLNEEIKREIVSVVS